MDVPSQPDVLALPTRKRLFAELNELRRPAGTEELAGRVGLHPNGVRTQLERLREAGIAAAYALTDLEPDVRKCMADPAPLLRQLGERIAVDHLPVTGALR